MLWLFAIVILLVLGGVAVVAAGHGDGLSPTYDDRPDVVLPTDRPLTAADLRRTRFTVSWRGYRTSEVDALLARLSDQLPETAEGAVAAETAEPAESVAAVAAPVEEPAAAPEPALETPVEAPAEAPSGADDSAGH